MENIYAPVVSLDVLRTFLTISVQKGFQIRQADVSTAFLFATSKYKRYLELPQGQKHKDGKTKIW